MKGASGVYKNEKDGQSGWWSLPREEKLTQPFRTTGSGCNSAAGLLRQRAGAQDPAIRGQVQCPPSGSTPPAEFQFLNCRAASRQSSRGRGQLRPIWQVMLSRHTALSLTDLGREKQRDSGIHKCQGANVPPGPFSLPPDLNRLSRFLERAARVPALPGLWILRPSWYCCNHSKAPCSEHSWLLRCADLLLPAASTFT